MANIALTKIVFAGLVGTFLIATLFGVYSNFLYTNGVSIDEPYNSAFQQIGAQYDNFGDIASTSSNQGLVKNILNFGKNAVTGTVNIFVVGLDAIGSFFTLIPVVGNVISIISETVPGLTAVLGLFFIIFTLYIAMRYIQTASNKQDLP